MECPDCQTVIVSAHAAACPHCGAALGGTQTRAERDRGIVESTAERGPISAELPLPAEGELESGREDAGGQRAAGETHLVVSRVGLPAVLWRQPAVRAVAQAGAGALALTLGVRLLRAWLARPRAIRAVASSALPVVADLLQSVENPGGASWRQERGVEVTETVIYLRRIVRRH